MREFYFLILKMEVLYKFLAKLKHYGNRSFDGSKRVIKFTIQKVCEIRDYSPLRFGFIEYSYYNPRIEGNTKKEEGLKLKCIAIEKNTPSVSTFYFRSDSPLGSQIPGQYATFDLDVDGEVLQRTWTISSAPALSKSTNTISISVKKASQGKASTWLHNSLKIGTTLTLRGIGGEFSLFSSYPLPPKILFLSGGIGITPMISMLRALFGTASNKINCSESPPHVTLLYSAPSIEETAFLSELLQMQSEHPQNFFLHLFITRQSINDASNYKYSTGRINSEVIKQTVPDLNERNVYLCGPEGFMQSCQQLLQTLHFRMENLHMERFDF